MMPEAGWLPVDVCAYLLGRPESLTDQTMTLEANHLVDWLDATELSWLPSVPDLTVACQRHCDAFRRRHDD